jgi:tripartite-type tricarboxylate transporter receptor subunit TctC
MQLQRRQFLALATGMALSPAATRAAPAHAYPTRPVRWIVAGVAGNAPDTYARLLGAWLSERFGQPVVIENRAGAGGNIGTAAAVRAPADGYTLLLVSATNAISATLYDNLNFNFIRDIAPVAAIARVPLVLVASPALPIKTVPELIAYAKAHPGRITMATGGKGTSPHLSGELFKIMAGIDIVHVPYLSVAHALTHLVGGQVQIMFDAVTPSIEHIKAGKLRALAVTTAGRWKELPDVPIMSEFLPGFEASGWFGVGAPMGTPAEIVERLNREINAGLRSPTISDRLADTAFVLSPAEFAKFIADETQKWAAVVKKAGIKPD